MTTEQLNKIQTETTTLLNTNKYYNFLTWNEKTPTDYSQFINLSQLQDDLITWVETNIPSIATDYAFAMEQAENGLNLHGYTINQLVTSNQLPQTKQQIENYKNGENFHNWLQSQANSKYATWQLDTGLEVSVPLLELITILSIVIYFKTTRKYIPFKIKQKELKNINKS